MSFRDDFHWGAATASYQIEGAFDEDGKGPSVWDRMARWDGRIYNGHTGDTACDHYHRLEEDVRLMAAIGLKSYRFSISWPRVMPNGTGAINEAGLAFYDRLVDALLDKGIKPWATLFHWDYPLELYYRGGWLNADSPQWFEDYTRVIVDRLSDRVQHWMTLNEPQCFIGLGHEIGEQAPGLVLPWSDILRASHHALLAHGRAAATIREHAKTKPTVGWAPVGFVRFPLDNDPDLVDKARTEMFALKHKTAMNNTMYSDPAVLGHYPEDGLRLFHGHMPAYTDDDMKTIAQPLDFYGANIYNGIPVTKDNADLSAKTDVPEYTPPAGAPQTMFNWLVVPDCIYWGARFLHERYKLPIVITENGMSGHDWVAADGKVYDMHRIDFVSKHLKRLRDATDEGVEVLGYFLWSLMDNFEWAHGYKERFGITHIDFQTLKRTPKQTAHWYHHVIKNNGTNLDLTYTEVPELNTF